MATGSRSRPWAPCPGGRRGAGASREALCFKGRRLTFADLAAGVDRAAKGLIALGIRPGDKVALWLLNRPEWIEAAFAVMKIGAVLVPINTRLRTEDVAYIADQSDSTALILAERSGPIDYLAHGARAGAARARSRGHTAAQAPAHRPVRRRAAPGHRWLECAACVGGAAVDDAALAARAAAVDPEDLAFLMYTSGTTGFPKGAMHAHRMIRNVTDRAFRLAITEHDVIMMYLPLFHLFAFSEGMLMSMVSGARQVLTEGFDPAESLDLHRARAGHRAPRLRHALQGADGGPRARAARHRQRAHRHLRRRHAELDGHRAARRASSSARWSPASA